MSLNKIYIFEYKSSYGELLLGDFENQLCLCDWKYRKMRSAIDTRIKNFLNAEYEVQQTELIKKAVTQLEEYFQSKRKIFDIPLLFAGTDFQQKVWSELQKIPFGETESYLGLAKRMNNEGAVRAVAAANGANAISIIVPCHRIIGSNGALTGYAGGLSTKKKLLFLERKDRTDIQLSLF
jgi:methylated-DNA-[protein]-cysteine S-methyltransferase